MVFFGPILDEWEHHNGLSWSSKTRLIGMTVVIVVVTGALTPLSPVAWAVILVIASLSILGVLRLPDVPDGGKNAIRIESRGRRALAAP
jgi:uncharacterized membrane protein YbaN (DUF454 family)